MFGVGDVSLMCFDLSFCVHFDFGVIAIDGVCLLIVYTDCCKNLFVCLCVGVSGFAFLDWGLKISVFRVWFLCSLGIMVWLLKWVAVFWYLFRMGWWLSYL